MHFYRQAIVLAFSLGIIVPSSVEGQSLVGTDVLSGVPVENEAAYRCSFTNLWSAETHPNSFPTATASWRDQLFVTDPSGFSL